jgi:hypothetical protein
MDVKAALVLVEREVYRHTNKHLTDLQQAVITNVLLGRKYLDIADEYGCTEGHAKDTGSLLWKLLAQSWSEKVTKNNLRRIVTRQLQSLQSNQTKVNLAIAENPNFVGRQQAICKL